MSMHFITAPFRLMLGLFSFISMIVSVILIYLLVAPAKQRQTAIASAKGFFSKLLLRAFNFKVEYFGQYEPESGLIISNHVSWVDVLLLSDKPNLHFVAKSEVKDWPIIGFLTQILGTLFIRRENKFQVYRSLPKAQALLKKKETVMVFPEGTTTTGENTTQFFPMMFEIAVREDGLVQPMAIRYWNSKGEISHQAAFIDEDGIMQSIGRLLLEKVTYAQVHFLAALDASKMNRKELAQHCRQQIQNSLEAARPPEASMSSDSKRLLSSRAR